jgi:phage terminase Nu1 subunit (DNA packaging protein)
VRLYTVAETCSISGASPRQLRHWVERGALIAHKRDNGHQEVNLFEIHEVYVARAMFRIFATNLNEISTVATLARKHLADVDILRAMGYDRDSLTTEHTVGDGLVLNVTE